MTPHLLKQHTTYWWERAPLWGLLGFTLVAIIGYGVFALHPENLAKVPRFAAFYGTAFPFFARVHVALTALVLGIYLVRKAGWRWLGLLAAVYAASLLSEYIGTSYGLPFGPYRYTGLLGPKILGQVPYLIPLSWFGMAIPSYVVAYAAFPDARWRRIAFAALALTAWDLSLDPAMSYLTSYWVWGEAGTYYGMPLINLAGWFATGLVVMTLLSTLGLDRWVERLSVRWMGVYYGLTLLMPLGMVLAAGLWGAVGTTVLAVGALAWVVHHRTTPYSGTDASTRTPPLMEEASTPAREASPAAMAGNTLPENLPDNVWDYFSRHSRSFSFAAAGFSPADRRRVSCVYAFCRFTDDLVDGATHEANEEVAARLDAWIALARRAYEGTPSGIGWLDEIMSESARAGVPFTLIEDLGEGIRMDLGAVALPSVEALNQYAYRVASVVGIWLCYLFGVTDPRTHERAAALGRAMQITNILRDVGEDWRSGRVYLPADLLRARGVERADLDIMGAGGTITPAYRRVIDDLMALAECYYEQAWEGILVLPKSFGRVVAVAAEVYRGIHRGIRRNGYDNFSHRARTTFMEKVRFGLGARWRLFHLRCERRKAENTLPDAQPRPANSRELVGWMARLATIILVVLLSFFVHSMVMAQTPEGAIGQVRQYYLDSAEDEHRIDTALVFMEEEPALRDAADPLVAAYRGAFVIMRAKHAFWPGKKMAYLKRGLPVLDSLVQRYPNHIEIRYLRLLSCYYLPRFLGRSWSVEKDIEALARLLPEGRHAYPPELFQTMVRFVLDARGLDAARRQALEEALLASIQSEGEPRDDSTG